MSEEIETEPSPSPLTDEVGQDMHVHKPKAAHSLREFLSEIGVIVVGILIALALEQVVEAVRTGAEVREAREALHAEIRANASVDLFGLDEDKCLLTQLDGFAAWARGGPKPAMYRTVLSGLAVSTWDTVKSGAFPHMPLLERLAIARVYDTVNNEQKSIDGLRTNALVLFGASERTTLSQGDAARVLDAVAASRLLAHFHAVNSKILLEQAAGIGVRPPPLTAEDRAQLAWECGRSGVDPIAR